MAAQKISLKNLSWDNDTFSSLAIMGMRIGMLAAKFILSLFMARYMGLEELGIYGLIVGASGTVQAALRGGVFTLLSRDAVHQSLPDITHHLRHYGTGIFFVYFMLFPIFIAGGWYFGRMDLAMLILAVFFTEHLCSDAFILINNLQYPKIANFVYSLQSAIWIYLFVILGFLYPSLRSLETILIFWIGGGIIALAIAVWLSRRWPWRKTFSGKLEWHWYPNKIKSAFKLYLTDVFGVISYYLDRYIVAFFLNLEMVGIYVFFSQVVTATLNLINSGVLAVYRPRLIKAYDGADPSHFNDIFRICLKRTFLSAFFLALFAGLSVASLARLTDNSALLEYIPLLGVMLVAMIFLTGEMSAQTGLFAMHKDRDNFVITLMNLSITAIVGSAAVMIFGVYGTALNMIVASLICTAYAWIVWEKRVTVLAKGEKKRYA